MELGMYVMCDVMISGQANHMEYVNNFMLKYIIQYLYYFSNKFQL